MNQSYSEGQKQAVVKKVLTRGNRKVSDVAQETGVGLSTIYVWMRKYAKNGVMNDTNPDNQEFPINKHTPQGRQQIIKELYSLPESERGGFIRSQGLYLSEVENWIGNPLSLFDGEVVSKKEYLEEKRAHDQEKKAHYLTHKELQRKEKALAETAALLVLEKKIQKLFGSQELSHPVNNERQ
jgi:transposase